MAGGELLTTVEQGSLVYGSRERPRAVREVPDDGEGLSVRELTQT